MRSNSAPRSTSTTPTTPSIPRRRTHHLARTVRGGADPPAARSACCSGSCRGTTRTTRWRGSRAPTSRSATPSSSSTRRSARIGRRDPADLSRRRLPDGAYVNVYATNEQVATIIADPRVQGVSLTGSERAGAAVAEIAGRNLKKVVLELGGSDPFIVLSSDDLDATVEAAIAGRFENTGQACNAAKRFIVAEDIYDAFVDKFTEKVLETAESLPPLSSVAAAERLDEQVSRGCRQRRDPGIRRTAQGCVLPARRAHERVAGLPAYREELFGPVAIVYRVASEEEAVEVANDTPFGLGSYVFTTDKEQASRVADRLEAGMVYVNLVGADSAELPFGGVKRSGFGRELGWSASTSS